jgi:hypothetical protein
MALIFMSDKVFDLLVNILFVFGNKILFNSLSSMLKKSSLNYLYSNLVMHNKGKSLENDIVRNEKKIRLTL